MQTAGFELKIVIFAFFFCLSYSHVILTLKLFCVMSTQGAESSKPYEVRHHSFWAANRQTKQKEKEKVVSSISLKSMKRMRKWTFLFNSAVWPVQTRFRMPLQLLDRCYILDVAVGVASRIDTWPLLTYNRGFVTAHELSCCVLSVSEPAMFYMTLQLWHLAALVLCVSGSVFLTPSSGTEFDPRGDWWR